MKNNSNNNKLMLLKEHMHNQTELCPPNNTLFHQKKIYIYIYIISNSLENNL